MYCKNCGNQISDDAKTCVACGQVIGDIAQDDATIILDDANEEIEAENSAANDFANPSFETVEAPKKSKKKLIASVIAIVLVVAIVLTAVFNFDYFKGFYLKTFGSDVEYYTYVEKKALSDAKDSIVKFYGAYAENAASGEFASKGSIKFKVGDEFKNLAPLLGGGTEVFESFEDIELSVFSNQHDDLSNVKIGLALSDTTILSADIIMDLIAEEMYIGIPELSKSYLKGETSYNSIYGENAAATSSVLSDKKFIEALPDDGALDRVLDKCIDAVLASIENVKASNATLEAGGFSEEFTVLECEISEKTALRMAENVLKAIRDDADVKAAINDIKEYGVENELCAKDEDIYGEFQEEIDDLLKDINEDEKEVDEDGAVILITNYVNSNHEIVGRRVSFEGEEVFTYYKLHDGSDFATVIDVADAFKITGTGTENGDATSGDYSIEIEGEKYLTVSVKDFETSDEVVKGSIKIAPDKALYDTLDASISTVLSLYDPAIELVFDANQDYTKTEFNLMVKNSLIMGVEFNIEQVESSKINLPENSVDVTDAEAIQEWANNIDIDAIKKNLEKAGLSAELLDQLLGELTEQSVQTEDYYDDYYGDYDDSYDDYYDDYDYYY